MPDEEPGKELEPAQPPAAAPVPVDDGMVEITLNKKQRTGATVGALCLGAVASIAVLRGTDGSALIAFIIVAAIFGYLALVGRVPRLITGKGINVDLRREKEQLKSENKELKTKNKQAEVEITAADDVMTYSQKLEAFEITQESGVTERASSIASSLIFETSATNVLSEACRVLG